VELPIIEMSISDTDPNRIEAPSDQIPSTDDRFMSVAGIAVYASEL
jgi:hypothetical protein